MLSKSIPLNRRMSNLRLKRKRLFRNIEGWPQAATLKKGKREIDRKE